MQNMDEVKIQLDNFKESIERLNEVLKRDYLTDDIVLDATIQRFEFTFENAWKAIKLVLKFFGEEALSPREAIKQALRHGWIKDEEIFLTLLKSRNITSHTYAKRIAIAVYDSVKLHHSAFKDLYSELLQAYN